MQQEGKWKFKQHIQSSSMLVIMLIVICIVTLVLSIILYLYLFNNSQQIENLSIEYVKSNSMNTIIYLKEILQNKIRTVSSNLYVLSSIPFIKQQNFSAISNLEAAQSTTNDLTEGYGWINEKGMGIWSTTFTENKTTRDQFSNLNASQRQYFLVPKETFKPFVSDAFVTPDYNQVPRIVISYPILSLKSNSTLTTDTNVDVSTNAFNMNSSNLANYQSSISNSFQQSSSLDSEFLKNNFDFKGIITASINAATLDNYINYNLFKYTISVNDSTVSSIIDNDNKSSNITSIDQPSFSNESINIQYSNIRDPISSLFSSSNSVSTTGSSIVTSSSPPFSLPSLQSSIISLSPRPNLLLTDNSGVILYSSDERIKVGSNYISPQNLQIIKGGYETNTAEFLISILNSLSTDKDKSYSGTLELVNKEGNKSIINFEPISLNSKPIFYLSTNTNFILSDEANVLISSQIMFTFIFIGILLLTVFSFIAIVLFVNRKLKHQVKDKTAQLEENISTLEKANERLIESEQMEREFINTAAHELRTPTQAIMGYTELDTELFDDLKRNRKNMTEEKFGTMIDQISKHHDSITRNASRLDNLINNLLDVARIESNKDHMLMLKKEKVDLVKEINDIVETQLGQKLADKNIKINFINEILNEDYLVYVDRSRLNQILNNLLDNTIKFSPKNTSIDIMIKESDIEMRQQSSLYKEDVITSANKYTNNIQRRESDLISSYISNKEDITTYTKDNVYVAISDSGKGISLDILPKLFEKFVTNSETGTGLVLYITKKLVEAMGGQIWAYNNDDGVGSTFVFSLPRFDNSENNTAS